MAKTEAEREARAVECIDQSIAYCAQRRIEADELERVELAHTIDELLDDRLVLTEVPRKRWHNQRDKSLSSIAQERASRR